MTVFKAQKDGKLSEIISENFNGAASYSLIMKLLRKKDVKINGKRTGKDENVSRGDEICIYADIKDDRAERILYEDEDILVVYKPKGITSEDFYELIKQERENARFIHRLDRNTDGIMIFALTETANAEILKGFKERTFKKYYNAAVCGKFEQKSGTLTAYLKKDKDKAEVKIFKEPTAGAEKIITKYKVLKEDDETSLVEVELVTGKTHQIRAHLAFVGHPVIGDGKYGYKSINDKFRKKSQMLTAKKIVLKFEKSSPLYRLDGKTFEI